MEKVENVMLGTTQLRIERLMHGYRVGMLYRDFQELSKTMLVSRAAVILQSIWAAEADAWNVELKAGVCSNFLVLWFATTLNKMQVESGDVIDPDEWVWVDLELEQE